MLFRDRRWLEKILQSRYSDSMIAISIVVLVVFLYEQGIVASAADILFQTYLISGDEKYLEGGKRQFEILSLFNGRQPDSCLYETAIRHWDGFWFGKRRLFGDTFPHYWCP